MSLKLDSIVSDVVASIMYTAENLLLRSVNQAQIDKRDNCALLRISFPPQLTNLNEFPSNLRLPRSAQTIKNINDSLEAWKVSKEDQVHEKQDFSSATE